MPQKRLFVSDSFAVLEDAFATATQAIREEDSLFSLTVLVPTNLLALRLRRLIARRGKGHFNLRFFTLIDFAREVAGPALAEEGFLSLSPLVRELIIKRLLTTPEAYFAPLQDLPGVSRTLLATLEELKQAGISAADLKAFIEKAKLTGLYRQKILALADFYERYNHFLQEKHLADDPGLLAKAADFLGIQSPAGPLLVYGFYDFTLQQRRLVEAAVSKTDSLVFFPWRQAPPYELSTPTLSWLTALGFQVVSLASDLPRYTDLARVQQGLFAERESLPVTEPTSAVPLRDSTLQMISAPGETREVREIARAVLGLVQEQGLRFHEIGILLRNPEVYKELLLEAFSRLDIPVFLYGGLPLSHTHAGKAFLLLCQVLQEDFLRERVLEFLTFANPPFPGLLGEKASHALPAFWEQLSIKAGIVKGKEEWWRRLLRMQTSWQQEEKGDGSFSVADTVTNVAAAAAEAFVAFMGEFFSDCERVLPQATWKERVQTFLTLFDKYVGPSEHRERTREEIGRLENLNLLGGEITVEEWTESASRALSLATVEVGEFERKGVFVGDALSSRGVSFRAVIIPGLTEGGFPRFLRQDPLLGDEERQHLSETLLLEMPPKRRLLDEERLLFTLAVKGAKESLTLTYPRLDLTLTHERLPSFYLLRVVEALNGSPALFGDLEDWCMRVPLSPFFAGPPGNAIDPLEFHLAQAVRARAQGSLTPLSYLSSVSPFFFPALTAQIKKSQEIVFTEFDGILQSQEAKAQLQEKFLSSRWDTTRRGTVRQGPAPIVLSPSTLETYARCPFRYFLSSLLSLTPLERPESVAGISPRDRGALVHAVLRDLFVQLKDLGLLPLSPQDSAVHERLLWQITDRHFTSFAQEGMMGFPLLWELEQENLREELRLLLRREREMEEDFSPAGFEVHFGLPGDNNEFSTSEPVPFPLEDGETVILRGRIDRIDVSAGRRTARRGTADSKRARIVDYKTGRPIRGTFAGGEALQLPLYLFAAKYLWPHLDWVAAGYTYTGGRGYTQVLSSESWPEHLVALKGIVHTLACNIKDGLFFATPSSCKECPFPLICGRDASARYERKKDDPRTQAFFRVKEIS